MNDDDLQLIIEISKNLQNKKMALEIITENIEYIGSVKHITFLERELKANRKDEVEIDLPWDRESDSVYISSDALKIALQEQGKILQHEIIALAWELKNLFKKTLNETSSTTKPE